MKEDEEENSMKLLHLSFTKKKYLVIQLQAFQLLTDTLLLNDPSPVHLWIHARASSKRCFQLENSRSQLMPQLNESSVTVSFDNLL